MSLAKLNLENVVFQIVGKTLRIIDNPVINATNTKKHKTINENDKRFGEIYMSQDGRFYYNCEFCNNNYFCIKYFTKHLIEEHKTIYTENASIHIVEELKIEDENNMYATTTELNQNQVMLEDPDMQMETVIYEDDSDNQNYIEQIRRQQEQDEAINENDEIISNTNLETSTTSTATTPTTTTYTYKDDNVRIVNDQSGNTYRIETVETTHHSNQIETEEQLRKDAGSVLVALETELLQEEYNQDTDTMYTNDFVTDVSEADQQQLCSQDMPTTVLNGEKRTFFDDLYDSFEYKKCKLCSVKTGQMLTHLKYKHPNAIKCDISDCNLPFDSMEEYNAHKAELHVNPNFPFQCKSCSYKCKYRSSILNHFNRIHLQKPKFQCNLCDKSFYAYHVRKRHIKECHPNGKLVTVVKGLRNGSSF